jgi:hypothetical protein
MSPFVRACDSTRIERILGAAAYLTSAHRDNPGAGCVLASLGPDVSRQGPPVRRAVTDYVRSVVDLLVKAGSGHIEGSNAVEEILDAGLAAVKG